VIILLCVAPHWTGASSNVRVLNDGNFNEVEKGEWAVDFYAPWCAHCRALEPVWDKVADELNEKGSKVTVAKLDAVINPASAKKHSVKAYPTIQFIRDGVVISEYGSGTRNVQSIANWIANLETKRTEGNSGEDSPQKASKKVSTRKTEESEPIDEGSFHLSFLKRIIRRAPILSCSLCATGGAIVGTFFGVVWALHVIKSV